MKRLFSLSLMSLTFLLLLSAGASAQLESIPEDRGATGLALALRKLGAGATFMHTAAHPDDEDNGLLVMMSRGRGLRTALLTVTRGDGGQNQIGTELEEALGVLRSAELMAIHRIDGAEQYFTRAYEFGYSFSVEETFEKWGKEEILADVVRIIRTVRPDVIVSLPLAGEGGGQHHQASGRLAKEAFRASSDPNRFPEQIHAGLRPWQPLKLYSRHWILRQEDRDKPDPPGTVSMNTGQYDPILGLSYYQLGLQARANHLCQRISQLRGLPGEHLSKWIPQDAVVPVAEGETDLFDGVPIGLDRLKLFLINETSETSITVREKLNDLQLQIDAANDAYDAKAPWKTLEPLREGLETVRRLRHDIASGDLGKRARYELEQRLSYKERSFAEAIALAHGLALDAIANRHEVVPGGELEIKVQVTNQSAVPVEVVSVDLEIPNGWKKETGSETSGRLGDNAKLEVSFKVVVGSGAELDRPYWVRNRAVDLYDLVRPEHFGLPFAPPAASARVTFRSGSVDLWIERPVQHRYPGTWVGTEKQDWVAVLPKISLALAPKVMVVPVGSRNRARTASVSVAVLYKGTEEATGSLRLQAPSGWNVSPVSAPVRFQREDEAITLKFELTPPDSVQPGRYEVEAVATLDGKEYREGFQRIAYHHIQTRYLFRPARATIQVLDVRVAAVRVGYIMGVGDEVAEAARQLGADVVMLDEKDLAEGNLSQFDLIITGIRSYFNRADLRAYNQRLLEYVENGGTMIVLYNRQEWDDAQWGPYPAKYSRSRITVEEAPVRILESTHPLFNYPNRITEDDWKGWVQERGTYFLGERDERYRDLLASEDPWEYNAGEKRGMLVEAQYGKGRWIYVGLTLFRQLPAGVPDAYKFFANLLSLPKAPDTED